MHPRPDWVPDGMTIAGVADVPIADADAALRMLELVTRHVPLNTPETPDDQGVLDVHVLHNHGCPAGRPEGGLVGCTCGTVDLAIVCSEEEAVEIGKALEAINAAAEIAARRAIASMN